MSGSDGEDGSASIEDILQYLTMVLNAPAEVSPTSCVLDATHTVSTSWCLRTGGMDLVRGGLVLHRCVFPPWLSTLAPQTAAIICAGTALLTLSKIPMRVAMP